MTLEEAKRILGLKPDEDPAPRWDRLVKARERLAARARTVKTDAALERHQKRLMEMDQALARVREEKVRQEGGKLEEPVEDVPRVFVVALPDEPETAPEPDGLPFLAGEDSEEEPADEQRGRSLWRGLVVLLLTALAVLAIGWVHSEREAEHDRKLAAMSEEALALVEARRWAEAEAALGAITALRRGEAAAAPVLEALAAGKREEQQQFVGYWSGASLAALEAGRLDDAEAAADKVLERYPDEQEARTLKERVAAARVIQLREAWQEKVRTAIEKRDWPAAEEALKGMAKELPGDNSLAELSGELADGREKERIALEMARSLAARAKDRDQGVYDEEALEWVREALALAPQDAEIRELYDRLAAYTRTLRVPEDFPSLAAAMAVARAKDRIVIGEGVFDGAVIVNEAVRLEGAGAGKTELRCAAGAGPVVTFGPGANGALASGLTFRHLGFDEAAERFPVVLVRGGRVGFGDCRFADGSAYGLAALERGGARADRCHFSTNAWGGAAARGPGSRLELNEAQLIENFGHGVEVWDGATAAVRRCVSKNNSRNGVLIDSAAQEIEVVDNEVIGNREYGIVLTAGASGELTGNVCRGNLLGGVLVRLAAISVRVEGNRIEGNAGPGLVLEQGLLPDLYRQNEIRGNRGTEVAGQVGFVEP